MAVQYLTGHPLQTGRGESLCIRISRPDPGCVRDCLAGKKTSAAARKKWTLLKAFAGMFILCTLFSVTLFSLAILCSGGTRSSYTAHYEYSSGGSKSCSGITVFDAELNNTIKICRPTWIGYRDEVRVVKVSNDLGIVVKEAVIL
ncbi:hypothetical protein [Pseudomonas sp. PE-S1G-1]|uniref:hypothetical protein n=1 Tax=Pseudomonas sp. PE-S1G-1 TaxID=1986995 RepID=UPI0021150A91|nr:hypothetical protein [Pseudomonas sp. PE-S1G-1]